MHTSQHSKWKDRAVKSILNNSSESKSFSDALDEWAFTGLVIDNKKSTCTCELCQHEHVRYHYIISNKITLQRLKVGSSCIIKYPSIKVYDAGSKNIENNQRKRQQVLDDALKVAKINLSLNPLRKLWKVDTEFRGFIESQADRIKEKKGFSPKVYLIMLSKFKRMKIDFDPDHYSINLRKKSFVEQLDNLKPWQAKQLLEALSPIQVTRHTIVTEIANS
ncbi:hypothetical protein [Photobacterium kishitanii]|nr:hypothetical protein [Photobacterium kishitanii]